MTSFDTLAPTHQDAILEETLRRPRVLIASGVKSRVLYMDVLRVVASFFVVLIHSSAVYLTSFSDIHTKGWYVANILDSGSRWCVPIFLMISGAFILGYKERYSTQQFFLKRFSKVLIPFVIWTGIYIAWQMITGIAKVTNRHYILDHTIFGPAIYHMWFFYTILGLYLITPILAVFANKSNKTTLLFLAGVCIIQNMAYPLVVLYTGLHPYFNIPLTTQYVDYFLLGWILKDVEFKNPTKWLLYALGAAGVAVTIIENYRLSVREHKLDFFFLNYENFATFFTAIAVFTLIKSIPWEKVVKGQMSRKILSLLANASLGIYLIHVMILYYFTQIFFTPGNSVSTVLFMALGGAVIVFTVSTVIVLGLQKIPVVKYIVP